MHKECLMADRGPQKAGAYERPARMKGMIIGIVVLVALIISGHSLFFRTACGSRGIRGGRWACSQ